jgi:RNA polymerase sigma-54 factor
MALGPRIDLRQSQSLVMTPQLQQAIKLLALSNVEIEAFIAEELAKNPLLEATGSDEDGEAPPAEAAPAANGDEDPDPAGSDELIAGLGGSEDQPLDYDSREAALDTDSLSDLGGGSGLSDEAFDFDRLSAAETSLTEHLLEQLHGLSGSEGMLAVAIVQELEETGYLTTPLDEIAKAMGATHTEAERALAQVQDCDPPGVAARDLAECLALQAKAADRYDPAMARLIANLDLLAKGQMAALKRICGVDDEDLADMVRELRAYDPKPGCRFAEAPSEIVNRRYYTELKSGPQDKSSKAWLSECLASAGWLVKALDQRARTIVKVASAIVERQDAFFREGVRSMKPLTLREVAAAVEVHESTVSRVTSNKYLLCDRGMFELKYFFGSGVGADEAGEGGAAAEAVKSAIGKLIAAESEILSDDTLVDLLKAEGFDLARRTVAKYREAMGIGSSIQRRRQRAMAGGR